MSKTKYILGHFADPDEMMHGIDKLQENNIPVYDVFTPMPIHGSEAFTFTHSGFLFWSYRYLDRLCDDLLHAGLRLADEYWWEARFCDSRLCSGNV